MSIPGLGQIPVEAPPVETTHRIRLEAFGEFRFEVPFHEQATLKLVQGTAEKEGTELALEKAYTFCGVKTSISTLTGCELEIIDGSFAQEQTVTPSPMPDLQVYMNLHHKLTSLRTQAGRMRTPGPRVLVCGTVDTGKTTLLRTLAGYATRVGARPLVVNLDPNQGMLTLPGTLSAAVFGSIMDVESVDGWGSSPSSGPGAVPVKIPLVYYYGHAAPQDEAIFYRTLLSQLAGAVTERYLQDTHVRSAGLLIDTAPVDPEDGTSMELLGDAIEEFTADIVLVLGNDSLHQQLLHRFPPSLHPPDSTSSSSSSSSSSPQIVLLEKAQGVRPRNEIWRHMSRDAAIKEYFFGNAAHTLSPFTQALDIDQLNLYQAPDLREEPPSNAEPVSSDQNGYTALRHITPTTALEQWTVAIMNVPLPQQRGAPLLAQIRASPVLGFVFVAQVDAEKAKAKILMPASTRLHEYPLVWGQWPEPHVNLLG